MRGEARKTGRLRLSSHSNVWRTAVNYAARKQDASPASRPARKSARSMNPTLRAMLRACVFAVVCLATRAASAHTFGTVYNLPVPFSMYAFGVAAALGVSFLIVA